MMGYGRTATQPAPKKKANKFGAKKVEVDGLMFDSKREAKRYRELCLRLREKENPITDLRLQVKFYLEGKHAPLVSDKGRRLSYVADFVYREADGTQVIEDSKGFKTPDYKLKKAILRAMGYTIREV